jgi:hypothetical protein
MIAPSTSTLEARSAARARPAEHDAPAPATPWKCVAGWLLVGLALRLLVLPLAVHPDLLAAYDRVRLLDRGTLHWFDLHLQVVPIGLHWLFAHLFGTGLPVLDGLPWPTTARDTVFEVVACELTRPGALLDLCLWKLPYVLADLGCGLLCWRLAAPAQRTATLRLWMLHPFLIYVSALFGKYEALMALPFLLGWLDLRRGREERAFVLFGCAVAMRLYPLLFVLPMALCASRSPRRRLELLALALVPTTLALVCCATRSDVSWLLAPIGAVVAWRLYRLVRGRRFEWIAGAAAAALAALALPRLAGSLDNAAYPVLPILKHASYLLRGRVALSSTESILLFLGAWGFVVLWALRTARARVDESARIEDVADAGLLATLAFVAFGFSLPQYEYLLVPLLLLQLQRLREARLAHAAQLAGLFLLLLDSPGGDRTTWLFLPLAPDVVPLTRPPQPLLADATFNIPWVSVGRTLLVLGTAWLAIDLLRTRARREPVRVDARHGALALAAGALAWPLGLAGLLALVLRVAADEPIGPERAAAGLSSLRPLDGYAFRVGTEAPTSLQVRLEDGQPVPMPGHRVRLDRVDRANDEAGDYDGQELLVPAASLVPNVEGSLRIDLAGLRLEPDSDYVVRWQQRDGLGTSSGARLRLLKELAPELLRARFLAGVQARFLGGSPFGAEWLAGALLLLLAGAALARPPRPSITGSPPPR